MSSTGKRAVIPNATALPKAKASVVQMAIRQAAVFLDGLRSFENIADSTNRLNERFHAFSIDLRAQTVDMDIDNVRRWIDPHLPDVIQNHRTGHDAAFISAEVLQQNELLSSQLKEMFSAACLATNKIQLKVTNFESQ